MAARSHHWHVGGPGCRMALAILQPPVYKQTHNFMFVDGQVNRELRRNKHEKQEVIAVADITCYSGNDLLNNAGTFDWKTASENCMPAFQAQWKT